MKKRVLSLLLTLALCLSQTVPALADYEFDLQGQHTSGPYSYNVNDDGSATIISFNKDFGITSYTLETLSIPATLDGHPVVSIGNYAFSYYMPAGIKEIIIPEGVRRIEQNAFLCSDADPVLTKLTLPSTLTYIGSAAFSAYTSLQTVTIPENVTFIGKYAFYSMEQDETHGLKTVYCYAKNVEFEGNSLFGGDAFRSCRNCVFYGYPGSTLEGLVNAWLLEAEESVQTPDGSWTTQKAPTGNEFRDIATAAAPGTVVWPDTKPEVPAQPENVGSFTDVKTTDYYADAVKWAVEKGITSGTSDTTFSPNDTCSRGQIITFLWRAAGSPEPKNAAAFSDVKVDAYYARAAAWAAEQGMAAGTSFEPNAPCTRSMAVEFMWKQAGSPEALGFSAFGDVPSNASYAQAVLWALNEGVTAGTSKTTFGPDVTCTRGQIITFLYRVQEVQRPGR